MIGAGELAALGAAGCWAICSLCFATAGKRVGSLSVNLTRLIMGMVILVAITTFWRGMPLPLDATATQWAYISASGFVGFFLGDMVLFEAYVLIGPRLSVLVITTWPIFAAVLAVPFCNQYLNARQWAGIVVTLAGVISVLLVHRKANQAQPNRHLKLGILLALLGGIGQAIGYILAQKGLGDYDAFSATQIRLIAALPGFLIIITFAKRWASVRDAFTTGEVVRPLMLGAVTGPALGVGLSMVALSEGASVGVAGTLIATAPLVVILLERILYKTPICPKALAGTLLAVAGVGILMLNGN
ncbi:MAG: DMT family transporter [Phycisphaerales bacterium]|jgi:drug/metabolite transporter (DMT)-like permease|nr:DMT family transporter [Phycisphaerales bacterium]MBT7170556.1 DMT family transporter [Phycisphaerales bacterium]